MVGRIELVNAVMAHDHQRPAIGLVPKPSAQRGRQAGPSPYERSIAAHQISLRAFELWTVGAQLSLRAGSVFRDRGVGPPEEPYPAYASAPPATAPLRRGSGGWKWIWTKGRATIRAMTPLPLIPPMSSR